MTATPDDPSGHALRIDANLQALSASAWRCRTETAIICRWFCPAPWRVSYANVDLRPGGRMTNVMQGPNGERSNHTDIWLGFEPVSRLVVADAFREGFIPLPNPFMAGLAELSDTGQEATRMIRGGRHDTEENARKHLETGFEQGWRPVARQLEDVARHLPT